MRKELTLEITTTLPPPGLANLYGVVYGLFGVPIKGATVSLDTLSTVTDERGRYAFESIELKTWKGKVVYPAWPVWKWKFKPYDDSEFTIDIVESKNYTLNISLKLSLNAKIILAATSILAIGGIGYAVGRRR
ncbi:MAG: carboxypeptidase-like regulatory domain-containing protein [Thermoproteota archaeon]